MKTGPLVAPTTDGDNGWALKLGDQGEFAPATHKVTIIRTIIKTAAMAHGRRLGLRSPRLEMNGSAIKRIPASNGPKTMKYCSLPCGSNASTAKYHSKYQSGRGLAAMTEQQGKVGHWLILRRISPGSIHKSSLIPENNKTLHFGGDPRPASVAALNPDRNREWVCRCPGTLWLS